MANYDPHDRLESDDEEEEDETRVKLGKKEKKLLKDAQRPLDSWERYRVLTDLVEEALDLVDIADHKARYAMVIVVALNVALYFVATGGGLVSGIPSHRQGWLTGYLLLYAVVVLYTLYQAVGSLRPRLQSITSLRLRQTPSPGRPSQEGDPDEEPLGLRFYKDVLGRDLVAYQKLWKEVRIGQLNNELAVQVHALAGIQQAQYGALRRLYLGLLTLTIMAGGLLALATLASALAEIGRAHV